MTTIAALILMAILLFLSGLHVYWVTGGKWGSAAVVPTRPNSDIFTFTPPPIATLAVAGALLLAASLVATRSNLIALPFPAWMPNWGVWAIGLVFTLRAIGEFNYVGLFKKVRGTDFGRMDTLLYSPLCLFLAILAFVVAFS